MFVQNGANAVSMSASGHAERFLFMPYVNHVNGRDTGLATLTTCTVD
jgi:hypothetical protein